MAKNKTISFAALEKILRQFGYSRDEARSGEKHITFAHPDRPLAIFMPNLKPRNSVSLHHLVMVRRMLEEYSQSEAEEFEAATGVGTGKTGRLQTT